MLSPEELFWATQALKVDRTSAEIVERLEREEIDVMLVKGPVIAAWLYPGEVRGYGDSDLLVGPADWDRAVALLTDIGFRDFLGPLEHPRMESQAGTGFVRDADNVDLHATLAGFDADPQRVWDTLRGRSSSMSIGGREIRVPDRATVLAHIALHAVHHVEGKPIEDLRRAVRTATEEEWRAAAALASELDGQAALASGIRLDADGERVLRIIGLDSAGSIYFDLRTARVPLAEGMDELLAPGLSLRERAGMVGHELIPNPDFMRWWSPLARRSQRGLMVSYVWRWIWLASRAPAALRTRKRVRNAWR